METKESILQRVFGYSAFRGGQEALIDAQLQGRDAFGIMPTGGGKSLCYQIPALLLEGVTLVISPLISLMRDQVMALKNAGVAAAYINSSLTPAQIRLVYRNIQSGMYKIIYVAPERLRSPNWFFRLRQRHRWRIHRRKCLRSADHPAHSMSHLQPWGSGSTHTARTGHFESHGRIPEFL